MNGCLVMVRRVREHGIRVERRSGWTGLAEKEIGDCGNAAEDQTRITPDCDEREDGGFSQASRGGFRMVLPAGPSCHHHQASVEKMSTHGLKVA